MPVEGVMVVTEGPRGCGYRKEGGKYLISEGTSHPCSMLPIEVTRCPCCDAGVKPARGWAWFSPKMFFTFECPKCKHYELGGCEPFRQDRAGIMWMGSKFYPTPEDWMNEADKMGVSRRISQIPKDLVLGKTWVFIGHRKALGKTCPDCEGDGLGKDIDEESRICKQCEGRGSIQIPGVFHVFRPTRIEQVVNEDITKKEADKLIKRGITPVVVNRISTDGNIVNEDGEPIDEWRTIRCANPDCDNTHVVDIEAVHDQTLRMAFSGDRDRSEYVSEAINWHSTPSGNYCSDKCVPVVINKCESCNADTDEMTLLVSANHVGSRVCLACRDEIEDLGSQ